LELVKIKPHNTAASNGPSIQVSILSISRMVTGRGKPKYLGENRPHCQSARHKSPTA
jgi:hypothetical protein